MATLREISKRKPASTKDKRLKVERLSMRIDPPSKAKLERAAAYSHESISDYVVTRALKAAETDIMIHEKIVLGEPVWNAFFEALNKPPKPNARLKTLLKQHDQDIISR